MPSVKYAYAEALKKNSCGVGFHPQPPSLRTLVCEVLCTIWFLVASLRLPTMAFGGHSLHRTGGIAAVMADVPVSTIQVLRQWRSDSFHRYLEALKMFVAQQVAGTDRFGVDGLKFGPPGGVNPQQTLKP